MKSDFDLDIARLEAEARQAEARRLASPVLWRIRHWLLSIAIWGIMFVVVLPLIEGEAGEIWNPDDYKLWLRLAMVVIVVATTMAFNDHVRNKAGGDPIKLAAQQKTDFDKFRGPGWVSRTVRMGLKMGMYVGLPIGILLVTVPIAQPASLWGRAAVFGMFVGGTLAWTIPAAFVIRWLVLQSLKKYMVAKPHGVILG